MLKYEEIAKELEKNISQNELEQGSKLPVLETLMGQYQASKSTVIKAISLLEKKGLVYQVRGSGIFVRKQKRKGYIRFTNQGFSGELRDDKITAKVIELDIRKPTQEAAESLNIDLDEDVYYVKRVRYINGQTLCLEESYYNKSIVTYLNNEIATNSIFDYISEALGHKIGFSDMYLHVNSLTKVEAEYLGLQEGEPKLFVETIFHLNNAQPFDFSRVTYNYQQSQFFFQSTGYSM
ncbi:GntR family transcriptional regulator [Alkalicoccobacillus plakortidis]|uniref:GntR family transcriptional regulator n=1 Tax=Alkalicoccobacillus plakortidis TaxID=444060 RepID=A0ABT0XKR5_9BACI|nr:GntR family transcriptional regulator [Alkalicoccobacillus plakortidis]MCM2676300.1 GntR family transcriptional regulator [Alkalicoccobacillus plakortidis]